MPAESALLKWSNFLIEAVAKLGRPIDTAQSYKSLLQKVAFENVVETQFKWPQNRWPKEKKFKDLGMWTQANVGDGLEGLSLFLFTHGLGWTKEEVLAFLVEVRKDIKNVKMHAYWPM